MSFRGFHSGEDSDDCDDYGSELPAELTSSKTYFDFFEDYQYPYSTDEECQYPSASASYSAAAESEPSVVNLLDTDFLEIFDELAKDEEASMFDSSAAVAMPIVYALPAAAPSESSSWAIQHATLIEGFGSKGLGEHSDRESKFDCSMFQQTQSINRSNAIYKWRGKRNKNVARAADLCFKSARQEATSRRPRTHGKFKKVEAKWIAATEYFHSATATATTTTTQNKSDEFDLQKSFSDVELYGDTIMV